ncbi:MAG: AMP-binding protein [Desulfobacterales bacterium]|nr:AMP-binding protein [Desulfobacterales bacterium]
MEHIDLKRKLPGRLDEFRLLLRQTQDRRESFWAGQAGRLVWHRAFDTVVREDFSNAEVAWFGEGRLNAAENALHRNIERGLGDRIALAWYQGAEAAGSYTFSELKDEVMTLAAAFQREGLSNGDCIALNLPNGPEFVICALAAAWLGVTYLPVGCHLPAAVVAADVRESRSRLLVTGAVDGSDEDSSVAEALRTMIDSVRIVTVGVKLEGLPTLTEFSADTDSETIAPSGCDAEHALFAIYENRLAGKPVGAVFATGGFLVQAHTSFDLVFNKAVDREEPELIVNTLAPSMSGSQAYGLWGALINGVGIVIPCGDMGADTILAVLEAQGKPALLCRPGLISDIQCELDGDMLNTDNRFSVIACCGAPLPPRLMTFAGGVMVREKEHLVNLWVQSKSGTALIHTYPSSELNRPGSLGFAAPGVIPQIRNDFGEVCKTNVSGNLVFEGTWPAMGRPTRGTESYFSKTYFSRFGDCFETFDGLRCDPDGFHWFMGRLDDVVKVKGQTLGTAQIESVITAHPGIDQGVIVSAAGDAAEGLTAFVVTREDVDDEVAFIESLKVYIAEKIGRFAVPENIVITEELPRTATGKLVRRLLKRIASGEAGENEDTGHLANASSVKALIEKHKEKRDKE